MKDKIEKATVTFEQDGKKIILNFIKENDLLETDIIVEGTRKKPKGLYVFLMNVLIDGLK